jgi:hypothetical protein
VNASGTQNPLSITMDQNKVIMANFTAKPALNVQAPFNGLSIDGFRATITSEFGVAYNVFGSTNLADWILMQLLPTVMAKQNLLTQLP